MCDIIREGDVEYEHVHILICMGKHVALGRSGLIIELM